MMHISVVHIHIASHLVISPVHLEKGDAWDEDVGNLVVTGSAKST